MSATRITGTVEIQNEWTGDYRNISVSFKANSEDAWVDIVDHACELAYKKIKDVYCWSLPNSWMFTGEDTLSETELEGC
tara:strand:+ start:4098 stop:4334 length:237 start_codon:yes stop_codon:yes gene_type:complete